MSLVYDPIIMNSLSMLIYGSLIAHMFVYKFAPSNNRYQTTKIVCYTLISLNRRCLNHLKVEIVLIKIRENRKENNERSFTKAYKQKNVFRK